MEWATLTPNEDKYDYQNISFLHGLLSDMTLCIHVYTVVFSFKLVFFVGVFSIQYEEVLFQTLGTMQLGALGACSSPEAPASGTMSLKSWPI